MRHSLFFSVFFGIGTILLGFATPAQATHTDGLIHGDTEAACLAETRNGGAVRAACKPGRNTCATGPQGEDLIGYCDGATQLVNCCIPKPSATAPGTISHCTLVLGGVCRPVAIGCGNRPKLNTCGVDALGIGQDCCGAAPPATAAPTSTTGPRLDNYQLLEYIPGSQNKVGSFKTYLEDIYKFAFWTVGIAVVLMLTVGGFMYMTSAGNTSRIGTAKTVITDALLGLVLALMAWLFLYVINPDLVNLTLPTSLNVTGGAATGVGTTPATPAAPTITTPAECGQNRGNCKTGNPANPVCLPNETKIGTCDGGAGVNNCCRLR